MRNNIFNCSLCPFRLHIFSKNDVFVLPEMLPSVVFIQSFYYLSSKIFHIMLFQKLKIYSMTFILWWILSKFLFLDFHLRLIFGMYNIIPYMIIFMFSYRERLLVLFGNIKFSYRLLGQILSWFWGVVWNRLKFWTRFPIRRQILQTLSLYTFSKWDKFVFECTFWFWNPLYPYLTWAESQFWYFIIHLRQTLIFRMFQRQSSTSSLR